MRYLKHLVVIALAATAACTSTPTSPSTTSSAYIAAQLEGTWILASIEPSGAGKQNRPTSAVYTLTFGTNNRLSTRADCNTCAGTFSVDGSSVSTGPNLACTRAACPTMSFESAYTSLLGGVSQAVVTNSTLTLSSSRGTISLVRQD
jgi:heat shock protein HslJ